MRDLARLKRRMGSQKFSSQMRNKPVAEEGRIFSAPYPIYDIAVVPAMKKFYMTVDPAATTNRESNQTGISIAFVDMKDPSRAYFKECYGVKLKPAALADEIVKKIILYRPFKVGIELGLQQALQVLLDIKIREWEGENGEYVRPHFVPISTGKTSKALKLERTIGAMVKDRRALFPGRRNSEGDLEPIPEMRPLFLQMDMYNPMSDKNDDDIVDSAGMMFQTIEHFAPAHWYNVKNSQDAHGLDMVTIHELYGSRNNKGWGKKIAC